MAKIIASLPSWAAFGLLICPVLLNNYLPHPLGLILTMAVVFIWIYSLGSAAHRALPQELKQPIVKFNFAIVYTAVYGGISSLTFSEIMPYAIPFHVVAMLCMFYSMHYAAKAIRTFELKRTARFEEWFATFCGIWFFPIGAWFVQKKIQRITVIPPQA